MINDLCLYTYTHSNCKDIWNPYFSRIDKYFPEVHSYVISNEICNEFMNHKFINHKLNFLNYTEAYLYGLEHIKNLGYKYVINSLEDFILYDNVNKNKIQEYKLFLSNNNYDFIRLIKSTDKEGIKISETLYEIPYYSETLYSMQATIWDIDSLIKIYKNSNIQIIRYEFKLNNVCRVFGIKGCYHFDGESQRGLYHNDSNVYPYIATALVLGKWNSEYQKEINDLKIEFTLDLTKRQFNGQNI